MMVIAVSAREQRLHEAKNWVSKYNGTKILRDYKKQFEVSALMAICDLQELGCQFSPGYVEAVKDA